MKSFIVVLGLFIAGCGAKSGLGDNMTMGERGGWSASNKILNNGQSQGNNVPLQVDFGQQLAKRAGLAEEFNLNPTLSDLPAKNYTVQFGEISWAVAGITIRRLVSVTNGLSVTGVGEAIKVVVYDATDQTAPAPAACTYDVEITVAPGSRPSEQQPASFTPYIDSDPSFGANIPTLGSTIITPNTTIFVTIPQNAGVISLYTTVAVTSGFGIIIPQGTALIQQRAIGNSVRLYDALDMSWVPIIPQAQTIGLQNTFPVAPGSPNLVFTLTFGIDG